jgi:hypothetical protein
VSAAWVLPWQKRQLQIERALQPRAHVVESSRVAILLVATIRRIARE